MSKPQSLSSLPAGLPWLSTQHVRQDFLFCFPATVHTPGARNRMNMCTCYKVTFARGWWLRRQRGPSAPACCADWGASCCHRNKTAAQKQQPSLRVEAEILKVEIGWFLSGTLLTRGKGMPKKKKRFAIETWKVAICYRTFGLQQLHLKLPPEEQFSLFRLSMSGKYEDSTMYMQASLWKAPLVS